MASELHEKFLAIDKITTFPANMEKLKVAMEMQKEVTVLYIEPSERTLNFHFVRGLVSFSDENWYVTDSNGEAWDVTGGFSDNTIEAVWASDDEMPWLVFTPNGQYINI